MSMIPIASFTISGSTTTSVTFTNIPQTFTHLQLRCFTRSLFSAATDVLYLYNFNNNGGSTGSAQHYLEADGASLGSYAFTGQYSSFIGKIPAANANANVFGVSITDILDYTNTNKNKTIRVTAGFDNNGSGIVNFISNLPVTLPGTSAITTLQPSLTGGNYLVAGSRFDLYGITNSPATGA